jgi:adenylate cyclase
MDGRLRRYLRRQGASREDIDRARDEGALTLLAIDRLLVPGPPELDGHALAELSGVPEETAGRLWRALGFPDAPAGQPAFTAEAAEVLRLLQVRATSSIFMESDPDALVNQVRAVGAGLTRVAEAISDQIAEVVITARETGVDDETLAAGVVDSLDWPLLARLNDYALRVQVRAALWRKLVLPQAASGEIPVLAVGFVDLVGYTAISQELDGHELAVLVSRFEAVTYDTVARLGARLVKTIGDEVMFVVEDPAIAVQVALALTARDGDTEAAGLPPARAGVSCGPALAREGDYYGSVVNLAHRLVEIARPGSVIVDAGVVAALEDSPTLEFRRLRSRKIRGIGRVEIYVTSGSLPEHAVSSAD